MKTNKAKTTSKVKFENRVRFNWGFHDASQAVEQGWATPEMNFGFGPAFGAFKTPEDVVAMHEDKEYARGWYYGYYETCGRGSRPESSEVAWNDALKAGQVSE